MVLVLVFCQICCVGKIFISLQLTKLLMIMEKYKVTLTDTERDFLTELTTKGKNAKRIKNALLLLNTDSKEGSRKPSDELISNLLKVNIKTVERIKKTFVEDGFEIALNGQPPQPRTNIKIDGEVEAHLIALTCSEVPEGYDSWTMRLLANKMVELEYIDSISHESVRQVLKKTKLNHGRKNVG